MKKAHVICFLVGTVFWGALFALVHAVLGVFGGLSISFVAALGFYVAATLVISVIVQGTLGGFPVGEPFFWFFYPVGSWVLFLLWSGVESLMINGN